MLFRGHVVKARCTWPSLSITFAHSCNVFISFPYTLTTFPKHRLATQLQKPPLGVALGKSVQLASTHVKHNKNKRHAKMSKHCILNCRFIVIILSQIQIPVCCDSHTHKYQNTARLPNKPYPVEPTLHHISSISATLQCLTVSVTVIMESPRNS